MNAELHVVGADIWRGRWVAVGLDEGGGVASVMTVDSIAELVEHAADARAIGLDVPIVLPEHPPRRADGMARSMLGPRRSSVFSAPPLDVVEATTYAGARRRAKARYGLGISAQSYNLRGAILDARSVALSDPRIVEVHPEVSFATMAGRPMPHAKKTWNGVEQRKAALAGQGVVIPGELDGQAGTVPTDDVLDAAAAAWSARRVALGIASSLPEDPHPGEGTIWY